MSRAMSEREIEDVLNSVRRLVAQAERRGRLPPLVLSPEMRVDPQAAGRTDPAASPETTESPETTGKPETRRETSADAETRAPERPARSEAGAPHASFDPGEGAEDFAADDLTAEDLNAEDWADDLAGEDLAAEDEVAANLPETRADDAGLPATLDEQALQELVGQIVREELHGKLGERITLAVRKLVRNEIARAMDEARRK